MVIRVFAFGFAQKACRPAAQSFPITQQLRQLPAARITLPRNASGWRRFSASTVRNYAKPMPKPRRRTQDPQPPPKPPSKPPAELERTHSLTGLLQAIARSPEPVLIYQAPRHHNLYSRCCISAIFMFGCGYGIFYYGNYGLPPELYNRLAAVGCALAGGLFLFLGGYFLSPCFNVVKSIWAIPIQNGARRSVQFKVSMKRLPIPFVKPKETLFAPQDLMMRDHIGPKVQELKAFESDRKQTGIPFLHRLVYRFFLTPIYNARMVLMHDGFAYLRHPDNSTIGKIDARGKFLEDGLILDRLIGPPM